MTHLRALLGALVLLALTSCAGGPADRGEAAPDASPTAGDGVAEVQPGGPGDPTTDVDPESVGDSFDDADVAFVQMMIPHHGQALVMARLAPERAASPVVRRLAERIEAAQGPEILAMAGWLERHDLPVPRAADDVAEWDHAVHGHEGMEGMLTQRELDELAASDGAAFDRLFLRSMIGHHEGALAMSDVVAVQGRDRAVQEMAADVTLGQTAEIRRMQDLLRSL